MRIKGVIFCVLATFGSLFPVCSRSDLISGVADDVVEEADPTLTGRFKRVDLDGDPPYSLPAAANPAFSTTLTGSSVIAGVDREGDTLAAYLQYNIAADTSKYNSSDSLEGVYLYFTAADSTDSSSLISLYRVDTLTESAPVNRYDLHPDADKDILTAACGDECESPFWPRPITLSGGSAVDSIKLPDYTAKKIFDARRSASGGNFPFAFSIVDSSGTARSIQNPDMAILFYKMVGTGDSAKISSSKDKDIIRAESSRFTVFENAGKVEERAKTAYTSRHTLRTAVFRIKIDTLNSLKGYTNLNAVITIKPGDTANRYRVFVSDTLFKDSDAASINEIFGGKNSSLMRPAEPYNTLSITASQSINPSLQSIINRKKEYLYVYVRADSDSSVITWDWDKNNPPVRLETVFIQSR